jgi:hypothetical protein
MYTIANNINEQARMVDSLFHGRIEIYMHPRFILPGNMREVSVVKSTKVLNNKFYL